MKCPHCGRELSFWRYCSSCKNVFLKQQWQQTGIIILVVCGLVTILGDVLIESHRVNKEEFSSSDSKATEEIGRYSFEEKRLQTVRTAPDVGVAEKWIVLVSGKGDYCYNKGSVIEIEKGIREVWDGIRSAKGFEKRQLRIDCARRKYAVGEAVGWFGETEIYHFYSHQNGWMWSDIENRLRPQLLEAVCTAE
jgi:hypothetical protein